MKKLLLLYTIIIPVISIAQIKHFLFIGMDRDLLKDIKSWVDAAPFDGVQIAYSWRQLEHEKDEYDFSMIREDLELLKKYNKKLFLQLQDVSFSLRWNHAPQYILHDTIYHGGANKQYKFKDKEETDPIELGWVTRRWDPAVQVRLHKLYAALGKEFDGIIEGFNTEETSVTFGPGPLHPPGFTYTRYRDAVMENLMVIRKAFPKSTVIAYANFMPGGYIPGEDSTLLESVYKFALANNIGVGGPDLLPFHEGQMRNSYKFIKESHDKVVTGVAVQDGTQEYIDPLTNRIITPAAIYGFARNYLKLHYIFWGTEEPYLHAAILPFLKSLNSK